MADVYVEANTHRAYEAHSSGISWSAIFAGAIMAWAMTILLLVFASAIGFSAVSPFPGSGVTMTEFHIASGLFTVLIALIASSMGGYITGRLRTRWVGIHTDEVYFRDTAHGLLSWALATVMAASVVALSAGLVAGGAAAGAGAGATSGMSSTLLQSSIAKMPATSTTYSSKLFRAAPTTAMPVASADTSSANTTQNSDADDIFTGSLRSDKEISAEDRTYLAQVISTRTGLTPEQANERIDATYAEARQTAEEARKAAVRATLWLTAALLMGAFAASIAATQGGNLRDRDVPVA
ncbi:MAG: hypothetical protein V4691_11010 [Pseudomonadota bacterium]